MGNTTLQISRKEGGMKEIGRIEYTLGSFYSFYLLEEAELYCVCIKAKNVV